MEENVINFLKRLFLWTKVSNKTLIYKMIEVYLPVTVRIINESEVLLDFGDLNDTKIAMFLKFVWNENRLIDIIKG
jgi:hypothetical protein